MLSETHALLGDLVVASVELAEAKTDPVRWLALATATAAALRAHPDDISHPLLDELIATFEQHDLLARERRAFEERWPRIAWQPACVMRSGFEALRDLLAAHAPHLVERVDMARVEQQMIQHGPALFQNVAVLDDTPAYQWWWFGAAPINERTIRTNRAMRALLPERSRGQWPPADQVAAPQFRALVARGFAMVDGLLFFRERVPAELPERGHETMIEANHSVVRFFDVLEPDPSRRPVDMATSALACARHLSFELRRAGFPNTRIGINVHPDLFTLRFHQIRPRQDWATKDGRQMDLDRYTSAMLLLDTEA